jgi:hypothetical protein
MLNSDTQKIKCNYCDRTYSHLSSYSRHKKLCKSKSESNQEAYELEFSKLKNDNEKKDIEIKYLKNLISNIFST